MFSNEKIINNPICEILVEGLIFIGVQSKQPSPLTGIYEYFWPYQIGVQCILFYPLNGSDIFVIFMYLIKWKYVWDILIKLERHDRPLIWTYIY